MAAGIIFLDWATWAKLSFVLSGALFMILTVAGLVKIRNVMNIRKHQKIRSNDTERGGVAQPIRSSEDIPFGIEAMQEDSEIDDVWNCQTVVPLHSPFLRSRDPSPSRLPLMKLTNSREKSLLSSVARLDMTEVSPLPVSALPIRHTQRLKGYSIDGATSGHCASSPSIDNHPRTRSITIKSTNLPDPTSNGQLSQSSQYGRTSSCDSYRRLKASTDPGPNNPLVKRQNRTLIIGARSSDITISITTPSASSTLEALTQMDEHRKLHTAESGQLLSRVTRSSSNTNTSEHDAVSHIFPNTQDTSRNVSWPMTKGEVLVNLTASKKVKTATSPIVTPFRAFVEAHPPPILPPKAPPSAWSNKMQGKLDEKLGSSGGVKQTSMTREIADENENELKCDAKQDLVPSSGLQGSDSDAETEVLSLDSKAQRSKIMGLGLWSKGLRERSNENVRPRKLQKRSRSDSRSSRSSIGSTQSYETTRQSIA